MLQSLGEVSSEVGVVSRMFALQSEALQKLKHHVMSNEARTQQQLVEGQISANASTRAGSEVTQVHGPLRRPAVPSCRGIIDSGQTVGNA